MKLRVGLLGDLWGLCGAAGPSAIFAVAASTPGGRVATTIGGGERLSRRRATLARGTIGDRRRAPARPMSFGVAMAPGEIIGEMSRGWLVGVHDVSQWNGLAGRRDRCACRGNSATTRMRPPHSGQAGASMRAGGTAPAVAADGEWSC